MEDKKKAIAAAHSGSVEKGSDIGKDLLSILIKANMASDVPIDQKLTDDEVLAQITTFVGQHFILILRYHLIIDARGKRDFFNIPHLDFVAACAAS